MHCRSVLRAGAVVVISAVLWLCAGTGSASAHAVLISSDPRPDAVVATVPGTVALTFSEPVVVAADGVRVFGPAGGEVDNGQAGHLSRSAIVGVGLRGSSHTSRVDQTKAQQGTYTVSWRVISADSHPVSGAFTFSVGHPSPSHPPGTTQLTGGSTTVGVVYAVVRAAAFACYALLVGSVGFVLLCWSGAITRHDVRRVMLVGWAGLLVTSILTLLLQGPYGNGLGLDRLFDSAVVSQTLDSRLGAALTARLALLALVAGYLVLLCAGLARLKRRGRSWCGALGVVLAIGLAGTWAAADHAAVGLQPTPALPVDVVHLVAMGLWLGGLVTLVATLRPADSMSSAVTAGPEHAVHRFSAIATGLIVIIIGTGSYQSWRQLGSWGAFGSTDYGRLLLVKHGVVALMLATAGLSHRWVTRHRRARSGTGVGAATRSALRRSVLGEAALGAVVLSITAMLVNAEPGRTATGPLPGPAHQVMSYDTGGPAGHGQLIVDVEPAATGPNTIRITVEDTGGTPREIPELRSTLTLAARELGPFTIPLQHGTPGRYAATGVQLPYSGMWQLGVTVRTSDIDETTVATPIDIR